MDNKIPALGFASYGDASRDDSGPPECGRSCGITTEETSLLLLLVRRLERSQTEALSQRESSIRTVTDDVGSCDGTIDCPPHKNPRRTENTICSPSSFRLIAISIKRHLTSKLEC